ncbi:hypothetical protein RMN57_34260 [Kitasatospora sp. CM 4170]|uniref:Integral membrane protein n=1 Tax=Kitasatospora aburaviensis TaxID=67265 RepID=A0ABW1F0R3_9ACTN|nr:hypothetical protein [Kitasatospora sp. CM 4170]WNM49398.1 hypothetical protein RMN57_34260 [Kitasatospora sp. CM 4170]
MDHGGTNEAGATAPEERELSTGTAVAVGVVAALGAAAVLLAVFHWLGWTVPGLGWLLAKGAVKLCTGGAVGLIAAVAWLRQRGRRN